MELDIVALEVRKFNHRSLLCWFGQRPGAFAVYLEPWHSDVFEFLELKKNTGKEEQRARDLFFAMWIPDLFMKRVESNQVNPRSHILYSLS